MSDQGGIGSVIQAVADHALLEAAELEQEADAMQARVKENRKRAQVLRDLHAIAKPHARETIMAVRQEAA